MFSTVPYELLFVCFCVLPVKAKQVSTDLKGKKKTDPEVKELE